MEIAYIQPELFRYHPTIRLRSTFFMPMAGFGGVFIAQILAESCHGSRTCKRSACFSYVSGGRRLNSRNDKQLARNVLHSMNPSVLKFIWDVSLWCSAPAGPVGMQEWWLVTLYQASGNGADLCRPAVAEVTGMRGWAGYVPRGEAPQSAHNLKQG